MRYAKIMLISVFLFTLLVACAAFNYRYYGIEVPEACYQEGKLLGKTEADDLPLTTCEPDANIKGKCVVLKTSDFERLRTDLVTCQDQLKACQQNGH